MSGGGYGGGEGGYSGPDSGLDCSALKFTTGLASPEPTVVATLAVDDVLNVQLQGEGSQRSVDVITGAGQRAGSITHRVPELLRCLQSGHTFAARVVSVDGGAVRVEVYSA